MNRYNLKSSSSAQGAKALRDMDASYDDISSQEYKIYQAIEMVKPDGITLHQDILGRKFFYSETTALSKEIIYMDFKVIHRGVNRSIMIGLGFVAIYTIKELAYEIASQIARDIVREEETFNRRNKAGVLDDWSK